MKVGMILKISVLLQIFMKTGGQSQRNRHVNQINVKTDLYVFGGVRDSRSDIVGSNGVDNLGGGGGFSSI